MPERYGPYTTVYNRFNRWAKPESGSEYSKPWRQSRRSRCTCSTLRLFALPARRRRKQGGPDNAIGCSRGGLSTKINAVIDQAGRPVRISLPQGQSSDTTVAPSMLEGLVPDRDLIADRGSTLAPSSIWSKAAEGGTIPTCRDRKVQRLADPALYRQRNLIEASSKSPASQASSRRCCSQRPVYEVRLHDLGQ